jgi:16S rRNA U516 pseudouridylate synthase RsuA-like enzyme
LGRLRRRKNSQYIEEKRVEVEHKISIKSEEHESKVEEEEERKRSINIAQKEIGRMLNSQDPLSSP